MRAFYLTWFAPIVLSPFIASCRNRAPDPVARVNDYAERANAHDIPAIMSMFAEDARFEMVGQGTLSEPDAIQAVHEYDKALETRLTLQQCRADELTVTCEIVERNNWLDAAGLDEIFYPSALFTFNEAGLIQRIAATLSAEDGAAMGAVLAAFIPWLMAERPEASAALFDPEGQFIYGEVSGRLAVQLLKEWQATKGG